MKTQAELCRTKGIKVEELGINGCKGTVEAGKSVLFFIASWGGGWDHVSVSRTDRCPRWEEMQAVKELFFRPEECAIQFHPQQTDYVNVHPYCLHLWRCQDSEFPMPPILFV